MAYKKFDFDKFASEEYKRIREEERIQKANEQKNKFVKNAIWSVKFYVIGVAILFLLKFLIGIIFLLMK